MLVEINDEQRARWFLSYSVGLWRGRIGTVALPLVDFLQRSSHERCLVVLGQAFGVAERRDALLIGQHGDRPRPVGAPHATIQPERIDDPQYRLPDIVVWERLVRHRAGTADLHPYVLVLSQGEQLGKIGPNVGGDRRASRLQQAEMVDNDDRIAVSLDVRQPFVQDAPAKQIDRQTMFGGGSESAVQTGMVRVHRQAVAHSYANTARAWRRRRRGVPGRRPGSRTACPANSQIAPLAPLISGEQRCGVTRARARARETRRKSTSRLGAFAAAGGLFAPGYPLPPVERACFRPARDPS